MTRTGRPSELSPAYPRADRQDMDHPMCDQQTPAVMSLQPDALPAALPGIVSRYEAYLRARTGLIPVVSTAGDEQALSITPAVLSLIFTRGEREWLLGRIEVRSGNRTVSFPQGQLARAIATLVSHSVAP